MYVYDHSLWPKCSFSTAVFLKCSSFLSFSLVALVLTRSGGVEQVQNLYTAGWYEYSVQVDEAM